jgi:predicted nucleic acid-binding protein
MKYLLDVNTLIALGLNEHQFHDRVSAWMSVKSDSTFLTCSITELGFVRVISQVSTYGFRVVQARSLLLRLKTSRLFRFEFLPDANDIAHLPAWVTTPGQTTDGHLTQLAAANNALLATVDKGIPGAYIIP